MTNNNSKNKFVSSYVQKKWNNKHARSTLGHYTCGGNNKHLRYGWGYMTPPGQRGKRSISKKRIFKKFKNRCIRNNVKEIIKYELDQSWYDDEMIYINTQNERDYDEEYHYDYKHIPVWDCSICCYKNIERLSFCSYCNHPFIPKKSNDSIENGEYGIFSGNSKNIILKYELFEELFPILRCLNNAARRNQTRTDVSNSYWKTRQMVVTKNISSQCVVSTRCIRKLQQLKRTKFSVIFVSSQQINVIQIGYKNSEHIKMNQVQYLLQHDEITKLSGIDLAVHGYINNIFRNRNNLNIQIPADIFTLVVMFSFEILLKLLPYHSSLSPNSCFQYYKRCQRSVVYETDVMRTRNKNWDEIYICLSLTKKRLKCYGDIVPILRIKKENVETIKVSYRKIQPFQAGFSNNCNDEKEMLKYYHGSAEHLSITNKVLKYCKIRDENRYCRRKWIPSYKQ